MPTYADLYNDKLRAEGRSLPSNPVRLTISKGEYVWDAQLSRFRYEEQWREEQLMEFESLDDEREPSSAVLTVVGQPESHRDVLVDARLLAEEAGSLRALQSTDTQLSLWVLDTNTLMSSLELLKALFATLLTRNMNSAAAAESLVDHRPPPCPLRLVIPYVVITELDGLKNSRRKDDSGRVVATMARDANTWLLSALQKQKRVSVGKSGSELPESLRPLFIQPSGHFRASNKLGHKTYDNEHLSNDQEIVRFCSVLRQQTGSAAGVWFCSDDINARTLAELDSIDTLGVIELSKPVRSQFSHIQSTEQRMMHVADALVEQWEYQLGNEPSLQPTPADFSQQDYQLSGQHLHQAPSAVVSHMANGHIEEVEMLDDEPVGPLPSLPPPQHHFHHTQSNRESGRNISDSIHAPGYIPTSIVTASVQSHNKVVPLSPSPDLGHCDLNPQIEWSDLVRHRHRG